MKYTKPEYVLTMLESEDIMDSSVIGTESTTDTNGNAIDIVYSNVYENGRGEAPVVTGTVTVPSSSIF